MISINSHSGLVPQTGNVFLSMNRQASPRGARALEICVNEAQNDLDDFRNGKGEWLRAGIRMVAAGLGVTAGGEALCNLVSGNCDSFVCAPRLDWLQIVFCAYLSSGLGWLGQEPSTTEEDLEFALETQQGTYVEYVKRLDAGLQEYLDSASRDAPISCIEALMNSELAPEIRAHANLIADRVIQAGASGDKLPLMKQLAPYFTDDGVVRAMAGWLLNLGGRVELERETAGLWRRFTRQQYEDPLRTVFFDEHLQTMQPGSRARVLARMTARNGGVHDNRRS